MQRNKITIDPFEAWDNVGGLIDVNAESKKNPIFIRYDPARQNAVVFSRGAWLASTSIGDSERSLYIG